MTASLALSQRCVAIEHLAKTVFLNRWREGCFAMLTAVFDASGAEDRNCVCVAGFVSKAEDWITFSEEWEAALKTEGLPYFRMSEFSGRYAKEYAGWEEHRKQALLAKLIGIIKRNTYRKFGCCIVANFLSGMSEDNRDYYKLNAYSLAGRVCVGRIRSWLKRENWDVPVEYVFEDGDKGKGLLMQRMEVDGFPSPIFKRKKDRYHGEELVERAFLPLQAADIMAYECYQLSKHAETPETWSAELRWPLAQLDETPEEIGIMTPENFADFDMQLKAIRDTIAWEKTLSMTQGA
jgi:hypothetical protein